MSGARVMSPQRNQVELREVDPESLLAHDHPARALWAFVQSMDLAPLYARTTGTQAERRTSHTCAGSSPS